MSGGTLILANPLTLDFGLHFSGGGITSGILDIFGDSSQTALMTVSNTTINNFGSYDITLVNGNAFSGGGSTFNNSGTLILESTDGTLSFNIALNNAGTVSAESGVANLLSGGTISGTASAAAGAVLQFGSSYTFIDGAQFAGAGLVQFNNATTTTLSGTIANNGNVLINSTGSFTDFVLSDDLTITGSGVLTLVNADRIRGSGTLTNAGSTIQGETNNSGSLGNNEIGIINQADGLIDANATGLFLLVDPNSDVGLTNLGTMQASDGGLLRLTGNGTGDFNNSGGLIQALEGSEVQLTGGATINGGTLATFGSGVIRNLGTATLNDVTNSGAFIANNASVTTLGGTINSTGSILINSTGSFTDLFINGTVTLTGNSTLTLQNAARVRGTGTLFNGGAEGEAFTIQGETSNSGSLGTNELGIVNRSGGLINANVAGLFLLVDPNVTSGLTNTGIMQASAGGLLRLTGNGGGDFNNSGGLIQALDGSEVQLTAGATINGGTLTTLGSGVIRNLGTATLNDVANSGAFIANNASVTTLGGTINSTGSILINSTGSFTDLFINGAVTLTGSTLTLQNAARVRGTGTLFNGGSSGEAFTIQGETSNSGSLGTNELGIVNRSGGLINANVAGLFLLVDPNVTSGLTNTGIMQASAGGLLRLTGNGGGDFNNSGGLIQALDGSEVQFTGGATINGGILTTLGSGVIRNLGTATLNDVTNSGAFIANNASVTTLGGTINSTASIFVNSTGSFTDLTINGSVTLTGGSTLTLQNAARVRGTGTLFNGGSSGEAFTIQGETSNSGSIGTNELAIVNRSGGLIDANVFNGTVGLALVVDPRTIDGLINLGVMRASGGGILLFTGNGGGGFTNTGGTISALTGSEVQLTSGASIIGGTLNTVGTGVLRNLNTATLTSLTNAGTFIGNNASVTTLNGTILNSGSFSINSTGSFTDLLLGSDVTLSGGGTVSLVNADRVRGGGILTNTDNTIQGETSNSGSLGNNEIGLVNQAGGVISANISGLTLNVDPNSTNGLVNQGTMQAINGGILRLNGNGGGTFTNNGTIKALSGGMLKFEGTITSSGTVDVGSDTLTISGSGSYTQTAGTFRLAGGTVTSSTALNFNGGLIDARGSINSAISNGGNLQPALGGNRSFRHGNRFLALHLKADLPARRTHSGQPIRIPQCKRFGRPQWQPCRLLRQFVQGWQ